MTSVGLSTLIVAAVIENMGNMEKYNELCRVFYPTYDCCYRKYGDFSSLDHSGGGAVLKCRALLEMKM